MPALTTRKNGYQTVNPTKGAPSDDGICDDASLTPKMLIKPKTSTYANGWERCDADYGDTKLEGDLWVSETMDVHPVAGTDPYDADVAYGTNKLFPRKKVVPGEIYELKCASSTFAKGQYLKCAANGLLEAVEESGTTTYKSVHTFRVWEAITSKTTVLVEYERHRLEQLS